MTYCEYCKREVEGTKKFSIYWAFFWFVATFWMYCIPGLIAYIIYWGIKPKRCPICNAKLDTTYHYKGSINENHDN